MLKVRHPVENSSDGHSYNSYIKQCYGDRAVQLISYLIDSCVAGIKTNND